MSKVDDQIARSCVRCSTFNKSVPQNGHYAMRCKCAGQCPGVDWTQEEKDRYLESLKGGNPTKEEATPTKRPSRYDIALNRQGEGDPNG